MVEGRVCHLVGGPIKNAQKMGRRGAGYLVDPQGGETFWVGLSQAISPSVSGTDLASARGAGPPGDRDSLLPTRPRRKGSAKTQTGTASGTDQRGLKLTIQGRT